MSQIKRTFGKVPTPMGGLALGIASIGSLWSTVLPEYAQLFKLGSASIAAVMLLTIIFKFFCHPKMLHEELTHPVVSSVMPTCAMAMMVIGQSFLSVVPTFAKGLWLFAIALHLFLLVSFTIYRYRDFQMHHMVPSWFVPPIGIIVAAVTSTGMGYEPLVHWLFVFGLVCYAVKLPIMMYRLVFHSTIADAALPTFAVMAAPASLSLAGYLTITPDPDFLLISILLPLAIFMTSLVYVAFFRLLRLPFSPGYSAFTFPMAIGATALYKICALTQVQAHPEAYNTIHAIAEFEIAIATVILVYVSVRYAAFFLLPKKAARTGHP